MEIKKVLNPKIKIKIYKFKKLQYSEKFYNPGTSQ